MDQTVFWGILLYNVFSFFVMGYDKGQAKRKGNRVSEKNLMTLTFLGGGLGTFLGSRVFHHKTQKGAFPIALPVGGIITIILLALVVKG